MKNSVRVTVGAAVVGAAGLGLAGSALASEAPSHATTDGDHISIVSDEGRTGLLSGVAEGAGGLLGGVWEAAGPLVDGLL